MSYRCRLWNLIRPSCIVHCIEMVSRISGCVLFYIFRCNIIRSDFVLKRREVKWSELTYSEVLGDKSTMYMKVNLYWGYLIVLWQLYLVCTLYCGCLDLLRNVWVFWLYVYLCLLRFILFVLYFVFFRLCKFILICFVCISIRTTATRWQLNCNK